MHKKKRQQAKQKRRERKKAQAKHYVAEAKRRRLKRDQYPKIRFDTKNGDPEFVDAVRTAVASTGQRRSNVVSCVVIFFFERKRKFYETHHAPEILVI